MLYHRQRPPAPLKATTRKQVFYGFTAQLIIAALVITTMAANMVGHSLPAVAAPLTANLWIDANGGSCAYQSTPAAYNDAQACGSMAAADAASSNTGSTTVRFVAGTYGNQALTSTAKTVSFIGTGSTTILGSLTLGGTSGGVLGNKVDNKTIDSFAATNGTFIGANNDTISNGKIAGFTYIESSSYLTFDAIDFDASSFATSDVIDIYEQDRAYQNNNHITIDSSRIHGTRAETSASHPDGIQFCNCSSSRGDSFHADNIVISKSEFYDNECINLRTNPGTGLTLENSVFHDSVNGISGCNYYTVDVIGANGTIRNNTFVGGQDIQANSTYNATQTWIGNAGAGHSSSCGVLHGTWSHNVWTEQKCSSTDKQVTNLMLKSDGSPEIGSPVIGQGDPASYPATDFTGAARGTPPDAGAYAAGVTSGAPTSTLIPALSSAPAAGGTLTLTTTNGTWSGAPTGYGYQWQQCDSGAANCTNISGATSATYTLSSANIGGTVRATVKATNGNGTGASNSLVTSTVASPGNIPGDYNADTRVTTIDVNTFLPHWGTTDANADLNQDGAVNIYDLNILMSQIAL